MYIQWERTLRILFLRNDNKSTFCLCFSVGLDGAGKSTILHHLAHDVADPTNPPCPTIGELGGLNYGGWGDALILINIFYFNRGNRGNGELPRGDVQCLGRRWGRQNPTNLGKVL